MKLFQYLNENIERIKYDVGLGIMPCSILRHWEIYARYDALKKMNHKTYDSVLTVSVLYKVHENTVFKIIQKMNTEI